MNEWMAPAHARWDPQIRHDMAMKKIRKALDLALGHPDVRFNAEDLASVAEMMKLSTETKKIDPNRTYRIRSTGEKVTGAEVLRRRERKA